MKAKKREFIEKVVDEIKLAEEGCCAYDHSIKYPTQFFYNKKRLFDHIFLSLQNYKGLKMFK